MTIHSGFQAALVEPSFADAIARIEAAPDLSSQQKAQWACALRGIARGLNKPIDAIPARWTAVRQGVSQLHHEPLGTKAKTLANHRSSCKAALAWFSGSAHVSRRGVPLSPAWAVLHEKLDVHLHRTTLAAFMRYCSGAGIAPEDVDEAVVDRYMAYRAENTRLKIGIATRRALARSWNACALDVPGWPGTTLIEPPLAASGIRLEDFPEGLRRDIDRHIDGLATLRRDARGKRRRPCKPSTIRTRRAELLAFVRRAVECGFPLPTLTSFKALLAPEIVAAVIDSYWQQNGEVPKVYTIDMAWKILALARSLGCFDDVALERLDEIREELDHHRQPGLTAKNRAVIRQVLADGVWRSVMEIPALLMAEATHRHNSSPVRAAVFAGVAVAIQILLYAPVRIGNLVSARVGENLIRPAGPGGRYWLVFPDYDVKNRVPLEFELNEQTTALIDRYIVEFRPRLLRGSQSECLFPGETGDHKGAATLSEQITERVFKASGVRLTAHQFRHAAAAIFLKHCPGDYEKVRQLLGHRSIKTTQNFYAGLETLQATRIFGDIIEGELTVRRLRSDNAAKAGSKASRRKNAR
jgi:integrase